jgi:deoxyhypusine synthase
MDVISLFLSQQGTSIKFIIAGLIILIIIWLRKAKRKIYRPTYSDGNMPAGLWFYSQLVSIEIVAEKADYQTLYDLYIRYLIKKYRIKDAELKEKTIFDIVKSLEHSENMLDFYGEIYNGIENLKHEKPESVIAYIKSIKMAFNKDSSIDEWVRKQRQKSRNCNDC